MVDARPAGGRVDFQALGSASGLGVELGLPELEGNVDPGKLLLALGLELGQAPLGIHHLPYQVLLFEPVKSLAAGAKLEVEVFCKAVRAGEARFKVELRADQLERGPVHEEENTTIFAEDGPQKE